MADRYHISPLEVAKWPYVERQRYLTYIREIEAGLKYRQALDNFKNGKAQDHDDEGGPTLSDIKTLKEESENKYGRWAG